MKHISLFTGLVILAHTIFSQEAAVNNFIYLPENEIVIGEYDSIICKFGTFYVEIRDRMPRLSLFCVSGVATDGTGEKDLSYRIVTIGLPRALGAEEVSRLNYSFKEDFLKNGHIVLEILGSEIHHIKAEETGEEINEYFKNNYP